jgi:membrane protein DedA with SNARE-associated domain
MTEIIYFIQNYQLIAYVIVFIAVLIEGDISLLVFGALSRERVLDFSSTILIGILASVLHDIIFWNIGRKVVKKGLEKLPFLNTDQTKSVIQKISPSIEFYVLFSKFAWNFSRIIITLSGYVEMKFKKFLKYSLASSFLWVVSYMSLGYVFADQTNIFKQKAHIAGIMISGVILLIILFETYIKRTIKKHLSLNNSKKQTLSN